jgi:hypothetical protein
MWWVVLRAFDLLIAEPLWFVYRYGPCVSPYIPMYCNMTNAEICVRLFPATAHDMWVRVHEDCTRHIQREFHAWKILVCFLVYMRCLSCLVTLGGSIVGWSIRRYHHRERLCMS